jgi:cell shape-determining protein MreD
MFLDLIDLNKLRRGVLYALFLLAVLAVQNLVLSHVSILGVRPMILPVAVAAVGLFEGGVWGGAFGLCAGLLTDMSFETTVLFTILFTVLGFLTGMLAQFVLNRRFFSYLFVSLAALLITALGQMFQLLAFQGADLIRLLLTAGLQTLWSLPLCIPVYFPCRAMARRK